MKREGIAGWAVAVAALLAAAGAGAEGAAPGKASKGDVARGGYLVNLGGCHDCHSPKQMTSQGPTLDQTRLLSGHRTGAQLPAVPTGVIGPNGWGAITNAELTAWVGPWGTTFAWNLTPDKTGLGAWTEEQFIKTMRTGKHLGVGRPILPPMPWQSIGALTDRDLRAIFAYLRSLPPVENQVPAPIPPRS